MIHLRCVEEKFSNCDVSSLISIISKENDDENIKMQSLFKINFLNAIFLQWTPANTPPKSGPDANLEETVEKIEDELLKPSTSNSYSHIPLLIFSVLVCLTVTCLLLGCFIIRALNRITTYGISAEELDTYAKMHGGTDTEKRETLSHSTHKKALRQGTYFTYVDEQLYVWKDYWINLVNHVLYTNTYLLADLGLRNMESHFSKIIFNDFTFAFLCFNKIILIEYFSQILLII